MRQQAEKYFDVHTLTYNETLSPEQKAQARQSLTTIVRQYSTAYEVPSAEIEDMARTTVQWRNWLYFRCLEGTNGWRELLDVQDCNWRQALADSREGRWPRPSFQCTTQGVLSRRFRLRVTRLGDGRFGEIQLVGWELFDAASGENIVRPGNGYIRAPGGLNPASSAMIDMGMGAWCHKCGSRQYTWLEWLVPNDQPPVAVSGMRLSGHPVKEGSSPADVSDAQQPLDFTLECIPVDVCAEHPPEFLQDYERPLSKDDLIHLKGEKPQRWITLDSREGAPLAGAADGQWVGFTPDSAALDAAGRPGPGGPRCVGFRLRFTSVAEEEAASEVDVQGLRLQVVPEDDLRPLCGGACSGSGGDFPAERCGPAAAFDGHGWTRWVDARAGGIGNTAVWEYEHTEEAVVEAYTITSQVGTFGIADGLHGAPRDWVLYTFQPAASGSETTGGTAGGDAESQGRSPTDAGDACAHPGPGWVELDRRSEVIYFNTRETKRFQIAKPQPGRRFRLVFTAVRCGCASSSLQVGDIELLARCASPSAPELLQASQALLQPSASHADMREAWWAPDDPTRLQLSLPIHANARRQHYTPPPLPQQQRQPTIMGLAGGTFKWGGMPLAAWYDWPMEFQLQCNETQDGEVVRYGSQPTIAYRTDRFKVDYGPDAVWASLSFDEDVVIAGIGLRNHFQAQPRGEPFRWRFEVWRCEGGSGSGARPEADGEGRWQVLLAVPEVRYDTHVSCGVFYLPAPSPAAQRFRFVFEEWWMPCPLAHLHTVLVLGWRAAAATAATEAVAAPCDAAGAIGGSGGAAGGGDVALRFRELASLDVMLRRWKRPARLAGYSLTAGKGRGVPTSWVLEGLTDEY
ncbi:hypothetical protein PLESTB_000151200 [Pleodorina starrii]|uniref:Uncharacterized protein n=1 Tax=Pleodorina starrii TaxID=330485 RepID=A0A9W6EY18_9CHLO|nr:hypothetical protein PLESTB_000151200 [Pleodorina starrii]GLC72549.1 hypothetical protein PLESTF_001263700 [Pleodorina starrii]